MKYKYANFMALLIGVFVVVLAACENPKPTVPPKNETISSNDDFGLSEFEGLIEEYESKERVIWQKPDLVINLIDDIERKTVADLGAGTGYFAFRLASKAEKVIAIDVDERWISFMDSIKFNQLTDARLRRFETRLGTFESPNLKRGEVDDILVVNTYIYINDRIRYFSDIKVNFRPNGRLTIVDFKPMKLPVGPNQEKKLSTFEVTQELQDAGYRIISVDESSLQYQYIIIAEPNL